MSASQKEEAENRIRKLEQQIKSHELDFMLYSEASQKLKAAAQEMMKKWMLDQQEAIQRALKKAEVSAKDQARAIIESLDNKTTSQACREF
jgi:hypothetical protein